MRAEWRRCGKHVSSSIPICKGLWIFFRPGMVWIPLQIDVLLQADAGVSALDHDRRSEWNRFIDIPQSSASNSSTLQWDADHTFRLFREPYVMCFECLNLCATFAFRRSALAMLCIGHRIILPGKHCECHSPSVSESASHVIIFGLAARSCIRAVPFPRDFYLSIKSVSFLDA